MMNPDFDPMETIPEMLLQDRLLGDATYEVDDYFAETPAAGALKGRFEEIKRDYKLMLDYMEKGYVDKDREKLYDELRIRLYRLTRDLKMQQLVQQKETFKAAHGRAARVSLEPEDIKRILEEHVTDMAMLGLQTDNQAEQTRYFYDRRQAYLSQLFDAIFVSYQWQEGFADFMAELIVSPTIDQIDAQVVVSAISLSLMQVFDIQKWKALVSIYQRASDARIRQRAFVGWVLSMFENEYTRLYPGLRESVQKLCSDEKVAREILELQMQVFCCLSADRDNETIQKDIIPQLVKNRGFDITKDGYFEKEDEEAPLEEVLNPHSEEEEMESIEEGIQKMMDMQRSGSDVYFGGFSQMKRFEFFWHLCNWFTPFYMEHPALNKIRQKPGAEAVLRNLAKSGPFCDSDKYSFSFAVSTVLEQIPDELRDAFSTSDYVMAPYNKELDMDSDTNIRRMYLQDLYRFFRLNTLREDFHNPFNYCVQEVGGIFFCSDLFEGTPLRKYTLELSRFLHKRHLKYWEEELLERCPMEKQIDYLLAYGYNQLEHEHGENALKAFTKAYRKDAGSERALMGLARASISCRKFADAEAYYLQLTTSYPQKKSYALNYCIAMIQNNHAENALNEIYRLHLESPDNDNVKRVLAWCLLVLDRREQATEIYEKLMGEDAKSEDYLNLGYCYWITGDIKKAVKMFSKSELDVTIAFEEDKDFLTNKGIGQIDITLMSDLVKRACGIKSYLSVE